MLLRYVHNIKEKEQRRARNQDNVSEWSDMSTHGLLFQGASTIQIQHWSMTRRTSLASHRIQLVLFMMEMANSEFCTKQHSLALSIKNVCHWMIGHLIINISTIICFRSHHDHCMVVGFTTTFVPAQSVPITGCQVPIKSYNFL